MPRVQSIALALLIALLVGPVAPESVAARTVAPAGNVEGAVDAAGRADATDRWIVVLRQDADVKGATQRANGRGISATHTFTHVFKGFAARLTGLQLAAVKADPDVAYVVHDEIVSNQGQTIPRGIRRTETTKSAVAKIDGVDERIDADVAIFDTGIDRHHEDLNVVGGHNCATATTSAWGDVNGHGTHVAGTVGALDNGLGVVGVAPGVRLWSVRILDSDGNGLVSWYVCGMDWLTAQREPVPGSVTGETRPVMEAVNMSVARPGADDHNCGLTNKDLIHRAICRLVASGVTVVAAAGNDHANASTRIPASYNEVITVSALADTDGKPGGLGGDLCYSWGTYDKDDTFADFSNYGADVDLIAPGKCTWSTLPGNRYGYVSGTSMAAPHVTGAVALYLASRPGRTPAQVRTALRDAATYDWNTATDPDGVPDRLLNTAHLVAPGDWTIDATQPAGWVNSAGATLSVPIRLYRGEEVADDIGLTATPATPLEASVSPETTTGLDGTAAILTVTVPPATPSGTYKVRVDAVRGSQTRTVSVSVRVDSDKPVTPVPTIGFAGLSVFNTTSFASRGRWAAATDPTTAIAAYQTQWSADAGATWSTTSTLGGSAQAQDRTFTVGKSYSLRVRARDGAGNYGSWVQTAAPYTAGVAQDTSRTITRSGSWSRFTGGSLSGGSARRSGTKGQWFSRAFTGRAIAWVAILGATRGKAQVFIDGQLSTTVDLHQGSTHYRRIAFTKSWATSAAHTIRVVVVGTAGHPRVDLDALAILH